MTPSLSLSPNSRVRDSWAACSRKTPLHAHSLGILKRSCTRHTHCLSVVKFHFAGLLVIASALILTAPVAHAQITNVTDDTSTPIPGAGHDYIHALNETVNPSNGSVSIHINVPMPKGRGVSLPFSFAYDSNGVHHLASSASPTAGNTTWTSNQAYLAQGGWAFSVPAINFSQFSVPAQNPQNPNNPFTCNNWADYIFLDPNGGRHALNIGTQGGNGPCGGPGFPSQFGGDSEYEGALPNPPIDTSNLSNPAANPVTVYSKNGTVYKFPVSSHATVLRGVYSNNAALVSTIEDRNGNMIVGTDNGNGVFSYADTTGRGSPGSSVAYLSSNGFGPSGATNTVIAGGLSYQVTWTTVSSNYPVASNPIPVTGSVCTAPPPVNESQTVISKITLPNGTSSYKFLYGTNNSDVNFQNPYGLLNEIDYPTGGWVKYKWAAPGFNEIAVYPGVTSSGGNVQDGCLYQYATPVVITREVSFDGSSVALTQTFTYSTSWSVTGTPSNPAGSTWTSKTSSISSTDNTSAKSALVAYSYIPITLPTAPMTATNFNGQVPVENTVKYFDWGNTTSPLRTVNKSWYDQFNLHTEKTVLDDGSFSQKVYCYVPITSCSPPATLSQVGKVDESDSFGNNRETVTSYQPFTTSLGIIAAEPCKIIVQDTAGANQISETDYLYDGATTPCGPAGTPTVSSVANLPLNTHDETKFGAGQSTQRGNLMSESKVCLNGTSVCTNATTTYSYDETGQALSITDPKGNKTQFGYSDSFTDTPSTYNTNTYLTSITYPLTSGISHTESFSYSYADGQLTKSTDQNGVQTQYAYGDSLHRLTGITYPNCTQCGPTSISYNDAISSPQVTKTKTLSSTQSLTNLTVLDGMGHVVQTQLTTDPAGADFVDTTYDGFGRVRTQSNPHRSTASSTDGTTTYYYDGLGRTCLVRLPDGGAPTLPPSSNCPTAQPTNDIFTQYSGFLTTVTDQAGNARRTQNDGLGRLTDVWEDPGAAPKLNLHTVYTYDRLNNLLTVVQNGSRNRAFTYDSLSRLVCASNPENSTASCPSSATTYTAGTTGYTYEANGNVHTKEDARGAASIVTYGYDALNRLLGKSYADSTPPVGFTYDVTTADGFVSSNPVGRLVKSSTGGAYPTATYLSYDAMGRVLNQGQCVAINSCGTTTPTLWKAATTYDLGGDPVSYTDGNGVTLSQSPFDGAGRPTQLTSTWVDATHPANLVTSTSATAYYPAGAIHTLTLGNGLTETSAYNDRLQPCELNLNSAGVSLTGCNTPVITTGNFQDFSYNYNLGTSDNGDVAGWTATGQQSFSRSYSYDSLNRLSTYADTGASQPCKGLSWTIDAWGNRTDQTVTSGTCEQFHASVSTANRIVDPVNGIYQYDAAGNMTFDGNHHYAYDAEGRLSTVDGTVFYVYDAAGRRVAKGAGSSMTRFYIYGPDGQVRSERDGSNNWFQSYIYFGGREIGLYRGTHTGFDFRDHLGSTRLVTLNNQCIFDVMDFLPFGEQIAGAQATSHMFTGKERDAESGLDNFGARYNTSSMGRFTSPDPLLASGSLYNPQTWNRYAYALNNPLRIVDPTGLWDWDQSAGGDASDEDLEDQANDKKLSRKERNHATQALAFRQQFRDALDAANEAAGNSTLSDSQQSAAQAAVNAYGSENDGNGVTVGKQSGHGASTLLNNDDTISVKFGSSVKGDFLTATVAHEGAHVDQGQTWLAGGEGSVGDLNHYAREQAAWTVGSSIAQALGMKSYAPHGGGTEYQAWNKGWKAADVQTLRSKGIGNILNFSNLKPADTDTYSNEHHHQ
jgi:RHS repeat-associated protein